jgi:hypothetical protein
MTLRTNRILRAAYRAILVACMAGGISTTAPAQGPVDRPVSVVLSPIAGLAAVSGDVTEDWKPSVAFGGEVHVSFMPAFALTGTVIYNEFRSKVTLITERANILEMGAGIKYIIAPAGVARPHIRFTVALYRRDTGAEEQSTNFGFNGGGGVDIDLPGSRFGFTAAASFHKIFITSTSLNDPSWQYFNLTGGLRIRVL